MAATIHFSPARSEYSARKTRLNAELAEPDDDAIVCAARTAARSGMYFASRLLGRCSNWQPPSLDGEKTRAWLLLIDIFHINLALP